MTQGHIPLFPFRVVMTRCVGMDKQYQETHNFQTLPEAFAYRTIALCKANTKRVEVLVVVDETSVSRAK